MAHIKDLKLAIGVAYLIMLCFGSRGFYNWVLSHERDSTIFASRSWAQHLWGRLAVLGLEQPALGLERLMIQWSQLPPAKAPASYAEELAHHRALWAAQQRAKETPQMARQGGPKSQNLAQIWEWGAYQKVAARVAVLATQQDLIADQQAVAHDQLKALDLQAQQLAWQQQLAQDQLAQAASQLRQVLPATISQKAVAPASWPQPAQPMLTARQAIAADPQVREDRRREHFAALEPKAGLPGGDQQRRRNPSPAVAAGHLTASDPAAALPKLAALAPNSSKVPPHASAAAPDLASMPGQPPISGKVPPQASAATSDLASMPGQPPSGQSHAPAAAQTPGRIDVATLAAKIVADNQNPAASDVAANGGSEAVMGVFAGSAAVPEPAAELGIPLAARGTLRPLALAPARPLQVLTDPQYQARRHGLTFEVKGQELAKPRLLLVGDSLMHGIGPRMARELAKADAGLVSVHAKISSGLARPDFFNWLAELPKNYARNVYDVAVVLMGANDGQSLVEEGQLLLFGSAAWAQAYQKRAAKLMDLGCLGAQRLVWLGLPPMRSQKLHSKVQKLNQLVQEAAQSRPCVKYVAMDQVLGDPNGNYTSYRTVAERQRRIRTADGVHLAFPGGDLVADLIRRELAPGASDPLPGTVTIH